LKKEDAVKIQNEIEAACEKYGLFCFTTHEKKPDLKLIRLEVSIKVEPSKGDK
jgi:hypothetical protein